MEKDSGLKLKVIKTNSKIHSKNKHRSGYNFDALCTTYPDLLEFVIVNKYNTKTIDFANPKAVKSLNTALLIKYYGIRFWEFPDTNLCPPIPSRVDYIHHIADLLKASETKGNINVLDIGTGATCIYPILGHAEYNWRFVGTDIDKESLNAAEKIIRKNNLNDFITLRCQSKLLQILKGVIMENDSFSITMCNPPFYKSEQEAYEATKRKLKGLKIKGDNFIRNFSGTSKELWYQGGEKAFLHNYLYESSKFKTKCGWFTSLVSKKDLLQGMYLSLNKLGATDIKTINMGQGNKVSRIVAWTFR